MPPVDRELMNESWRHVGVDQASGSWIAVGYSEEGNAETEVFDSIDNLWSELGGEAELVVVDVPIGLFGSDNDEDHNQVEAGEELSRECDDIARSIVGPQYRSVFTPPCREAAKKAQEQRDHGEINEINKKITGKGLSSQAAGIATAIYKVDEFVREKNISHTLIEGHPEVCFRAFADEELTHSKKTAYGVHERLTALEKCDQYEEGDWKDLAADLEGEKGAGLDDLLDALALALTARAPDDELQRLPYDDSPTDEEGLPMQMVYRRGEPFPA